MGDDQVKRNHADCARNDESEGAWEKNGEKVKVTNTTTRVSVKANQRHFSFHQTPHQQERTRNKENFIDGGMNRVREKTDTYAGRKDAKRELNRYHHESACARKTLST